MTYAEIYMLINASVMPAWALLIFAPRWVWTDRLVHAAWYPLGFGVFYSYWLAFNILSGSGASYTSIEGVMALFSSPVGILIGWSHYLVFDLFVGAWIGRDARRRDVPHWLVAPSQFFTLMFGPVGLMLYLAGRRLLGKGDFSLSESA